MVYLSPEDLDFHLDDVSVVPVPHRVLMTTPDYFDVEYVINPHMEGNLGSVDRVAARTQWNRMRAAYESLDFPVKVVDGAPNLPDMVFCANQTLPFRGPGRELGVVLSRMHAPQRSGEVPHYEHFFRSRGYQVHTLPNEIEDFEGMGDALWHYGRRLLWGGYGFRSSPEAYDFLSELLSVPVLAMRLEDPDFYHLDTCLSVLNETTILIFPGAFDASGLGLIRSLFPTVLEAPEYESRTLFACNAHSPDGKHVLIQAGCVRTGELLAEVGLKPVELHTEEYLKAGGSVFCMKQMFW